MIELALQAIDRMITLLRGSVDDKRKFVQEQVNPIFSEMEIIHKNYIQSLVEIIQAAADTDDRKNLIEIILRKKMEFEHIRVKVYSFANIARKSKRVPEPAKRFFHACYYYFWRQKIAVINAEYSSNYSSNFSSILEILSSLDQSDDLVESKKMLIGYFENHLRETRRNWEQLSQEYSQCKLEMLN